MGDDDLIEKARKKELDAGKTPDEAQRIANEAAVEAARKSLPNLVKALLDSMPKALKSQMDEIRGFDERMRRHWGRALDLLFMTISCNVELSEEFRLNTSPTGPDPLWQSLSGLYSRACRVAFEVHHLLCGGFPLGGYARARTLHEIAIITKLLTKYHGKRGTEDLAERYQLHYLILDYKDALAFKEAFGDCDSEVREQIEVGQETQARLCERFGHEFKGPQGWAFPLTGNARAGINDLEKLADLDHLRPHYKSMSHEVHADALSWRLNLVEYRGATCSLSGRTNIMLEEPAFLALGSLREVAGAVLLSRYSSKMKLLPLWAMDELAVMANDAFAEGGESVADAERRFQEREREDGGTVE